MTEITLQELSDSNWKAFCKEFSDFSYKQDLDYNQHLSTVNGTKSKNFGFFKAGELIGLTNLHLKKVPLLGQIAYINGGPLIKKSDSPKCLDHLTDILRYMVFHFSIEHNYALKIQPHVGSLEWNHELTQTFLESGFINQIKAPSYRTFLVDLSPDLDEIRSKFKGNWRRDLTAGEKQSPNISDEINSKNNSAFKDLFENFVIRKGFAVKLDANFYTKIIENTHDHPFTLSTIENDDGNCLAAHFGSIHGDTAIYILGATHPDALKRKCAYVHQWNFLKRAKARGAKWYDLGGIDPVNNPGVYLFKKGMRGQEIYGPGPFILKHPSLRQELCYQLELLHKKLKARG